MNSYDGTEIINIGVGKDHTIPQVAEMVARVAGFDGDFRFDLDKPDGTLVKSLDISKLEALG